MMSSDLSDADTCCKCGKLIEGTQVFIDLDRIAPPGNAYWGCFVCGADRGAIAVVCEACRATYGEMEPENRPAMLDWLEFAVAGDIGTGRVPISSLSGSVRHDLSKHPEVQGQ